MTDEKADVLGRLAVERGYVTREQLDETLAAQKAGAEAMGVTVPLAQLLLSKGFISKDQAQELLNAVAVETGEARLVAGYEVISKLGQGGMGAVYKAKQTETGRFVALKILPPSLANEGLVARFKREAEITAKLDHTNIVRCIEFGFDKRRKAHFCALELVEGEDLAKHIAREGALAEAEAVGVTRQVADALQHAFQNGLIHRDVKPENIMVTPDGTAKLLDLGLARAASTEATRLTQTGMFVGSAYYASPEQALGEKELDTRSDIYSLGCTLYHMLTGKPPFSGTTVMQILQKHVSEKLPWPADLNPDISQGLCRVVARMMAKSPGDRYQTPLHVLADLDLLKGGGEPEVSGEVLAKSTIAPALGRGTDDGELRIAPLSSAAGPALPPSVAPPPERPARSPARPRRSRDRAAPEPPPEDAPAGGLPLGAKIGIGAGVAVVLVVGLVMFLGGGEERKPGKPAEGAASGTAKPSDKRPGARGKGAAKVPAKATHPAAREPARPAKPTAREPDRPEPVADPRKAAARDARTPDTTTGPVEPAKPTGGDGAGPVGPVAAARPAGVPADAAEFRGHWYKLFPKPMSWRDAKRFCEDQGGHLVTVTSKEEHDFLVSLSRATAYHPWLGFSDERTEGQWEWLTGEPSVFTAWSPREPNNVRGQEHYASLSRDATWMDVPDSGVWGGKSIPACEWEPAGAAIAGTGAAPGGVELSRGLVGWWKFDETEGTVARDSSGKGNNGTLVGDAKWTGSRGGRMGGACRLGENGHVTTSVPGPHRTDLTWSAWIKTTRVSGTFLSNTSGSWQSGGKCLSVRDGKLQPNVCGVGNPDTGFLVNDGAWHHIAFTLVHAGPGRDTFTIYGDGAEMMRNTWDFYRYDGRSLMMRIGHVPNMVGAFEGLVDDVRIYERALSAEEVALLAGIERPAAAGVPAVSADVDIARGLVGWWKFDETEGTVARDWSGKGNNGTLVGDPTWRPAGGRVGGALELDGLDDCVDLVKTSTARAFSAALWVNKTSPRDGQCFLARHTGEGGNTIVLGYYDRQLTAHCGRGDARRSGSFSAGWQHVAIAGAAAGPGQMKVDLYLNGRRIGTHLFPDAEFKIAGKPWTVGQDWDGNSRSDFLAGLVDEVRIYDRAISAEEVALLADPVRLAAVEAAGRAKSERDERLVSLLAEFQSFVAKGDSAGAKTLASREASKGENKPHADALRAAARVADALAKRRDAIRKAAEALAGKQAEFVTAKGKLAGTVDRVIDEGIILQIKKKIRGMGTIETRMTVKWADLNPKDQARLAKAWKPEGPDGHVALAALALSRKDTAAARKALAEAGGHPLAAHYGAKIGGVSEPGPGSAREPGAVAGRPPRSWPPDIETIRRLFKGKLLKWDPRTLRIELVYDFSDEGQAADWTMSKYIVWGGARRGITVANGSMELMGSGHYVLHKASLVEASIEASATVSGGANSPGCLVCADETGSFHSMTGYLGGKAYLESCKGGITFTDHTPRNPSPIRQGTPTRISLAIDRSGRLAGSVGELDLSSEPLPTLWGHVGFRAFRSNASFKNVRIKGRFSRPWLEQALGRPATCGLLGTYFGTRDFAKPLARRIDPMVDFAWGSGRSMTGMPTDNFGVRWEGSIIPPRTGLYVLRVNADDGVRVWVGGRVVLDAQKWDPRNADLPSKPFGGSTGTALPLRIEYTESTGNAHMHLRWSGPGFRTPSIIPAECLRPPKGYEKLPGPPLRK